MSNAPILTVEMVMSAGLKRISSIADKYGINSPETLAACERWGGILDDINHPDTSCRNCGHPVTYVSRYQHYVHTDRNDGAGDRAARWCVTHAGAQAEPNSIPAPKVEGWGEMKKKPAPRKVIKK